MTENIDAELREDIHSIVLDLAHSMSNARLSALRAQNPFVPIVPFPNSSISALLAIKTPIDINLPEGTKYIQISATGEYYITRQGQANLPGVGQMLRDNGLVSFDKSQLVYVGEEIKSFSVISLIDNNYFVVSCYQQI